MAEFKECEVIMRLSPKVGYDPKEGICVAAEKIAELVRCKDCVNYKHHKLIGCDFWSCFVFDWKSNPDDYCSMGERREDGTD